jgi:hypothetical protein
MFTSQRRRGMSVNSPLSIASQADDDDLDDLSFGGPSEFAKPAASSSNTTSASQQGLSGRIGQDPNKRTRDEAWNGIRMQTRYTGESTLDEPVSKTIVGDRQYR